MLRGASKTAHVAADLSHLSTSFLASDWTNAAPRQGRSPSGAEKDEAMTYLQNDPARLKGLAWLLFNLDEFVFVR